MFEIIQEAALPKLSDTSLFIKFNESSNIKPAIIQEIKSMNEHIISIDKIPEIIALMKLNGDSIIKKAVNALEKGTIIIIDNRVSSNIPVSLPFLIIEQSGQTKAIIFADKVVNNINSSQEYTKLMATVEAAYLALLLQTNPNKFIMNRSLVLTLCNIYTLMVATPLEQKLYMKGDNLTKAMLYIITYFYRIIDGNDISFDTIPYKRIVSDKVDDSVVKQIIEEVKNMGDSSFINLLTIITKINPVRYKDLSTMYFSYFTSSCGMSILFALENPAYLLLLITSANYRTQMSGFGLNKLVAMPAKKAISLLTTVTD